MAPVNTSYCCSQWRVRAGAHNPKKGEQRWGCSLGLDPPSPFTGCLGCELALLLFLPVAWGGWVAAEQGEIGDVLFSWSG